MLEKDTDFGNGGVRVYCAQTCSQIEQNGRFKVTKGTGWWGFCKKPVVFVLFFFGFGKKIGYLHRIRSGAARRRAANLISIGGNIANNGQRQGLSQAAGRPSLGNETTSKRRQRASKGRRKRSTASLRGPKPRQRCSPAVSDGCETPGDGSACAGPLRNKRRGTT